MDKKKETLISTQPYLIRAIWDWTTDNGLTPQLLVDVEVEGVVVPSGYTQDGKILFNVNNSAVDSLELGNEIISFSATHDGLMYDFRDWGVHSELIIMKPGDGYTGLYDLLVQNRVHQFEDLTCMGYKKQIDHEKARQNITTLINYIKERYGNEKIKYHIIRIPNSGNGGTETEQNFEECGEDYFKYMKYDQDSEYEKINNILDEEPSKHTIIFIVEKLRCAITLNKQYLGILYERYTKKINDSVIIQGMGGRATGYNIPPDIEVYTNKDTIERYDQLQDSCFNDITIKWNSNTTKYSRNGHLILTPTFANRSFHSGSSSSSSNESKNKKGWERKIFETYKC